MLENLVARATKTTVPLVPVTKSGLQTWLRKQPAATRKWVKATDFTGSSGRTCLVPGAGGTLARVLVGIGDSMWSWSGLPASLPSGRYRIDADLDERDATRAALGWALGCYEFCRYRKPRRQLSQLVWPKPADKRLVTRLATGIGLARDLINTPADDMGPIALANAGKQLAREHGAQCSIIVGEALLKKNYPAVHAVGRAADEAPRLIDIRWGKASDPKLTLVGKGVCFDSGGLDLKSASNMKLMKKDMGGGATVFGLAHAIMDANLRVRLRVLVPAVENAVSGNAFRPLDVLQTRKGKTVEVGNTDAEGRLILCDALAEADSEQPDLIIDVATLTGAARVALGTELPALFCSSDDIADATLAAGRAHGDPLWRMPLHSAYRRHLNSTVADLNNISESRYGGAITAALFLREFVSKATPWIHIDTMGYNLDNKPGRPKGGEAFGLRALYAMCEARYGRR